MTVIVAEVATAVVAVITFLFALRKYRKNKDSDKKALWDCLNTMQTRFRANWGVLSDIFSNDNEGKALPSVLERKRLDLDCDTEELARAKEYMVMCRHSYKGEEMTKINNYIRSLEYCFNMIQAMLKYAEDSGDDEKNTVLAYKEVIRKTITQKARELFGICKTDDFGKIFEKYGKKINKKWEEVKKILKEDAE